MNKVCEYLIVSENNQFSLYRKLHEREEQYYIEEQPRLRKTNEATWLHLKSDENRMVVEKLKQQLENRNECYI